MEKKKSKYDEYIQQVDPAILEKWKKEQNELKIKLIENDSFDEIQRVGGMDISASTVSPDTAVVALVICDFKTLEVLYKKCEIVTLTQPYVPGYLAFREVEHLVNLLNAVDKDLLPQIILVDGNGIFHSNRFGLACHLGVITGIATVGCGKTVFAVDGINKYKVREISNYLKKGGDFSYLVGKSGDTWGAALKSTEETINPMIISIGHKICLDTAIDVVKKCIKFRVPEPIRIADLISRSLINKAVKK